MIRLRLNKVSLVDDGNGSKTISLGDALFKITEDYISEEYLTNLGLVKVKDNFYKASLPTLNVRDWAIQAGDLLNKISSCSEILNTKKKDIDTGVCVTIIGVEESLTNGDKVLAPSIGTIVVNELKRHTFSRIKYLHTFTPNIVGFEEDEEGIYHTVKRKNKRVDLPKEPKELNFKLCVQPVMWRNNTYIIKSVFIYDETKESEQGVKADLETSELFVPALAEVYPHAKLDKTSISLLEDDRVKHQYGACGLTLYDIIVKTAKANNIIPTIFMEDCTMGRSFNACLDCRKLCMGVGEEISKESDLFVRYTYNETWNHLDLTCVNIPYTTDPYVFTQAEIECNKTLYSNRLTEVATIFRDFKTSYDKDGNMLILRPRNGSCLDMCALKLAFKAFNEHEENNINWGKESAPCIDLDGNIIPYIFMHTDITDLKDSVVQGVFDDTTNELLGYTTENKLVVLSSAFEVGLYPYTEDKGLLQSKDIRLRVYPDADEALWKEKLAIINTGLDTLGYMFRCADCIQHPERGFSYVSVKALAGYSIPVHNLQVVIDALNTALSAGGATDKIQLIVDNPTVKLYLPSKCLLYTMWEQDDRRNSMSIYDAIPTDLLNAIGDTKEFKGYTFVDVTHGYSLEDLDARVYLIGQDVIIGDAGGSPEIEVTSAKFKVETSDPNVLKLIQSMPTSIVGTYEISDEENPLVTCLSIEDNIFTLASRDITLLSKNKSPYCKTNFDLYTHTFKFDTLNVRNISSLPEDVVDRLLREYHRCAKHDIDTMEVKNFISDIGDEGEILNFIFPVANSDLTGVDAVIEGLKSPILKGSIREITLGSRERGRFWGIKSILCDMDNRSDFEIHCKSSLRNLPSILPLAFDSHMEIKHTRAEIRFTELLTIDEVKLMFSNNDYFNITIAEDCILTPDNQMHSGAAELSKLLSREYEVGDCASIHKKCYITDLNPLADIVISDFVTPPGSFDIADGVVKIRRIRFKIDKVGESGIGEYCSMFDSYLNSKELCVQTLNGYLYLVCQNPNNCLPVHALAQIFELCNITKVPEYQGICIETNVDLETRLVVDDFNKNLSQYVAVYDGDVLLGYKKQ